ncbi:HEAT repeat domain-containing protein [Dactylosporangium sp. NPDC000521]|uniref:HEAT repeat domain-containing protein n=1 Tax=Dactylosporangium sp. NPDC000521 TaxID=3363975 RepID=UPI003673C414
MTADDDAVVRATACDLLGVLSGRHDDVQGDVATALIALAVTEVDDDVQWSIARALGATHDGRAVTALVDLAGHADSDVRFQAALSLPLVLTVSDSGAGVAALIALCADDDPEVRNWATFGLGWTRAIDGDDVRQALSLFDAVHAQRPDLDIAIFGERCEVGLWLGACRRPGGGSGRPLWSWFEA